jgi:hypothetical protein
MRELDAHFGFLFTDFKRGDGGIWSHAYYFFYVLRRLVFVLNAFYFQDYPGA